MVKSRRQIQTTVFYCVEGSDEEVFLKHLVKYFARRKTKPKIVENGGGSPQDIFNYALKRSYGFAYDKKVVWFDNDVGVSESLHSQAKAEDILILESSPCFEAEMLRILDNPKYEASPTERQRCKTEFRKKYLDGKTLDAILCEKIFPHDLLNKSRSEVELLSQIINLLEGNID